VTEAAPFIRQQAHFANGRQVLVFKVSLLNLRSQLTPHEVKWKEPPSPPSTNNNLKYHFLPGAGDSRAFAGHCAK
jgi:hypothetical protein